MHVVQLLQLRPPDQMPSVLGGQHSGHGPYGLAVPTLRQSQLGTANTLQLMSRSTPDSNTPRVWASVARNSRGTGDWQHRVAMQDEQMAPTVQYAPASKSSAPRGSVYREGLERSQKRHKMTYHPLAKDKIIPYPKSKIGRVEQQQPHQATAVKPDDDQGARGTITNAERMMCAKSSPSGHLPRVDGEYDHERWSSGRGRDWDASGTPHAAASAS